MKQQRCLHVGAVVIGRNEGERLKRCLLSVLSQIETVVYVDSGSSDGSPEYAASLGIEVVNLDLTVPFSAGRARNEGFKSLTRLDKSIKYVQFIDGDCELCPGWVSDGLNFLAAADAYAVVYGRVKERYPETSVYNWLYDAEWRGAEGEALSCGGIFLSRVESFSDVDGFNTDMVAGEEPEMCYRLRQKGWRLYSLSRDMTFHDAAMFQFSQWWKRSVRSGLAYAHGCYLHRKDKNPHHLRQNVRILCWTLLPSLAMLLLALVVGSWALLCIMIYPIQVFRQYIKMTVVFRNHRRALQYAFFNTIEKLAQFGGQVLFIRLLLPSRKLQIIEYK